MSMEQLVSIADTPVEFQLIRPYISSIGVEDINLKFAANQNHYGNYAVGQYEGKETGIRFGRLPKLYYHEAEGLRRLSHEGIPKCLGTGEFKTDYGTFGYMIVEDFPGKSLKDSLDFSTNKKRIYSVNILLEIVDIIDCMHSQNILHNDITPEHVLVYKEKPCLIDFHLWEETSFPTYDFCGRSDLPEVILSRIVSGPRLVSHDEVPEWDPRSYGMLLQKIVPKESADALLIGLRKIGEYLTNKSKRFIEHPKSRDFVSRKIRKSLEELVQNLKCQN